MKRLPSVHGLLLALILLPILLPPTPSRARCM